MSNMLHSNVTNATLPISGLVRGEKKVSLRAKMFLFITKVTFNVILDLGCEISKEYYLTLYT